MQLFIFFSSLVLYSSLVFPLAFLVAPLVGLSANYRIIRLPQPYVQYPCSIRPFPWEKPAREIPAPCIALQFSAPRGFEYADGNAGAGVSQAASREHQGYRIWTQVGAEPFCEARHFPARRGLSGFVFAQHRRCGHMRSPLPRARQLRRPSIPSTIELRLLAQENQPTQLGLRERLGGVIATSAIQKYPSRRSCLTTAFVSACPCMEHPLRVLPCFCRLPQRYYDLPVYASTLASIPIRNCERELGEPE